MATKKEQTETKRSPGFTQREKEILRNLIDDTIADADTGEDDLDYLAELFEIRSKLPAVAKTEG